MRFLRLSLLLFSISFALCSAANDDVLIIPGDPNADANPGDVVTLALEVINTTSDTYQLKPAIDLPKSWQLFRQRSARS